jgi:transposase ISL3 family protein
MTCLLGQRRPSRSRLVEAQARYSDRAELAAATLAREVHASVRDIARLMGISYQRVSSCCRK